MALCDMLAFWTGGDAARMDALFRSSGLMRPKWDERHYGGGQTYGDHTIEEALKTVREFYKPPLVGRSLGRIGMNADGESSPDAEEALEVRKFTDTGNAERLVDQYGTDIRFCHPWGTWLHGDGHRWKRDEAGSGRQVDLRGDRSGALERGARTDLEARQQERVGCRSRGDDAVGAC
jgi:putative DNA primase/helicase